MMVDLWSLATTFLISLSLCSLAAAFPTLFLKREHMLKDLTARQAQHVLPTPRIGGVAVIIAFATGTAFHLPQLGVDLACALLAGSIVFLVGLREDIARNVSPRARLLAAFISAGFAAWFSGALVPDIGIRPGILLQWGVPAVLVTLLWSAGTCHALNLIDGLNGLSSLYTISVAIGYFLIAGQTGDTDIQIAAALLAVSVAGFFVLNWPFGRIFLGDAGAYGIGHIVAWLGIILIARNPSVAGVAVLLLLFWPVADTLFSIIRRRINRRAADQPDRLHFHQLVVRAIPLILRRGRRGRFDNSMATILLLPFLGAPIAAGVWFWDHPAKAAFSLMFFIALFMATYVFSMEYFADRRFRAARARRTDAPARMTSPLSGVYVQDGVAVDVHIYRDTPTDPWRLQVRTGGAAAVVSRKAFETDLQAWEDFFSDAQAYGMVAMLRHVA